MSMAPVPSDSKSPTNEVPETQRSPDKNQNDAAGTREDNGRENREEGGGEEEGPRGDEEEEQMAPVPSDSKSPTNEVQETQRSPDKNQNDAAGTREDNGRESREEGGGEEEGPRGDEEEEQMECGFCLFMKGGGCKDSFISWEKCIEEAEKSKEDVVEKCAEVTRVLRECMLRHSDYYEPLLNAEKAIEDQAARELEQEEAAASAAPSEDPKPSQQTEGDKKVES